MTRAAPFGPPAFCMEIFADERIPLVGTRLAVSSASDCFSAPRAKYPNRCAGSNVGEDESAGETRTPPSLETPHARRSWCWKKPGRNLSP